MNHPTLKYLLNHAASTTMLQKLTVSRCTIERTAPRDRQPNSRGVSSQAPPPPPLPTSSLGNRASAGGATCAVAGRCASSSWRRPPDYWEPSPISRSPYKFSGCTSMTTSNEAIKLLSSFSVGLTLEHAKSAYVSIILLPTASDVPSHSTWQC